ncbi:MAG: ribonuclease P protein component [Oscillospiraceae bacterium]|nr:ribonuclease P protein component [Oscillospiraceae bacterium]
MALTLRSDNKIRNNYEFKRAYAKGKSHVGPSIITYALKNRLGYVRYGITTSKKIGNAVKRNRARRVIKAAYMALEPQIKGSYDLVFVGRARTTCVKSTVVQAAMLKQLREIGIVDGKNC